MLAPSILAHIVNGILLFLSISFAIVYANKLQRLDTYHILLLLLVTSVAVGIHGISHLFLEKEYRYNPLTLLFPLA